MTQIALQPVDLVHNGEVESGPSRIDRLYRRLARPIAIVRNVPHIGTWVGVFLAAAGAVLLAIAWGRTAGLTNVALQVPYIVSAGFTGLGLIATGLTVVNISAKQADARERTRQVSELRELLSELRSVVEDGNGPSTAGRRSQSTEDAS
jgi:hypothetical protein